MALLPFTSSFSKEQELQDTLTPYVPILLDSVQLTNFSHIGPAARWIGETCAMRNDINTCDTSFFMVQGCVKIYCLVVMQGTDVWHRIMS